MDTLGKPVAAHDATFDQINARLGSLDTGVPAGLERRVFYGGGALGLLIRVYAFL